MSQLVRRENGVQITLSTPGQRMAEEYEVGMAFVHPRFGTYFVPTDRQKNGGVKGVMYSPDTGQVLRTSVMEAHFEHWKLVKGVPRKVADAVDEKLPSWKMIVNESFLQRRRYGR